MLSDVLFAFLLFSVGAVVLVEAIGYFWHRFAEHLGWLEDTVRYRHWMHHELDYPIDRLRPLGVKEYRKAGSWTWFVVGGVAVALILYVLPLERGVPLALGVVVASGGLLRVFAHDASRASTVATRRILDGHRTPSASEKTSRDECTRSRHRIRVRIGTRLACVGVWHEKGCAR